MFPSSRPSRISFYLAWYDVCLFVMYVKQVHVACCLCVLCVCCKLSQFAAFIVIQPSHEEPILRGISLVTKNLLRRE
ncbi:hypothetical protein HanIR_Chr14g0685231 [Helianthus annuus]|nr:hypothetical protein HanIR_Chr14g0685231 [Helianthus annuus]